MPRTTYVILRKFTEGPELLDPAIASKNELWQVLGEAEGATDIAAIKQLASDQPGETYVAVPRRSFRERKGGIETQTRFKLT